MCRQCMCMIGFCPDIKAAIAVKIFICAQVETKICMVLNEISDKHSAVGLVYFVIYIDDRISMDFFLNFFDQPTLPQLKKDFRAIEYKKGCPILGLYEFVVCVYAYP